MFQLKGQNLNISALTFSMTVVTYLQTQKMVSIPTSTIINPAAWIVNTQLYGYVLKDMKKAFSGKVGNDRNKFGEDLAFSLNKWFMDPANQLVINVVIPGAPPIPYAGPGTPNTTNKAKDVLKTDLIELFSNIKNLSKSSAKKKFHNNIKKYFDSFKIGKEHVWITGPVSGYLP